MKPGNGKKGDPGRARAAMLAAIETQIRSNDPPETRQTFERLLQEGYPLEEALKLLASALVEELFGVLKNESQYDHARYVANLQRLPKLPWEKD
jgi:hypothetical protein